MVLIESISASVITEIAKAFAGKIAKQHQKEKEETSIRKSRSFSVTVLDRAKTSDTKWTTKDNPLLSFENTQKEQSTVKEISIIPDKNFKTKGKISIKIDDVAVFESKSFGSFEDVSESVIKINKTISQDSKVKIFVVSSDGTDVGVTVQVTFGE